MFSVFILVLGETTINHLFFECVVARKIWGVVSKFLRVSLGYDVFSIDKF
jgi:hypothetical protein